jgi:hypothetical protein
VNKLALIALAAATSPAVFASTTAVVSFTGLPATYESGTYGSNGATYNGEVVATINGIPSQNLVCDDFVDSTNVPSTVDFSVENISNLSGARFSSGFATIQEGSGPATTLTEVQAYDTAAVLLAGLESLTPNSTNANAVTNYQYAIWDLMNPGATEGQISDNSDITTTALQQSAFAAVLAGNTQTVNDEKSLVIYTPASSYSSNQEFLALNTSATPEPATWVLMAALGLLLCVPQVRRRLRRICAC